MDTETIINYLQNQIDWRVKSLRLMDKRRIIPKRVKKEIEKLKSMIKHLSE